MIVKKEERERLYIFSILLINKINYKQHILSGKIMISGEAVQ